MERYTYIRITSYNVCYTKLLRGMKSKINSTSESKYFGVFIKYEDMENKDANKKILDNLIFNKYRRLPFSLMPGLDMPNKGGDYALGFYILNTSPHITIEDILDEINSIEVVITSYSIHYTKLYDLCVGKKLR